MAERDTNRKLNLVFGPSGNGGELVADRNTGRVLAVQSKGGIVIKEEDLALLSRMKPIDQSLQDYIREEARGKK